MFIQGGATLQFAMIPWNLMRNGKATYIETGAWSKKAIAEAKKYGEVTVGASSAGCGYARIPDCSNLDIAPDTDYVYICENETSQSCQIPKGMFWFPISPPCFSPNPAVLRTMA